MLAKIAIKQFINFSLFIKQCYCFVWSVKKIQSKNLKIVKPKHGVCDSSKSRFIKIKKKKQEASGLWSNLGIKTPSSKIPLVGPFLSQTYQTWMK